MKDSVEHDGEAEEDKEYCIFCERTIMDCICDDEEPEKFEEKLKFERGER